MKKTVLVVGPSVPKDLKNNPMNRVLHCPLIELCEVPIDINALLKGIAVNEVIITSKHAARFFHEALVKANISFSPRKCYCVGNESAEEARRLFTKAEIVTCLQSTQEGLAPLIISHHPTHLVWPRSSHARLHLRQALERSGIKITELVLYTPVPSHVSCSLLGVDTVFFTCPSSVDAFFDRFEKELISGLSFQTIGPVTQARLSQRLNRQNTLR